MDLNVGLKVRRVGFEEPHSNNLKPIVGFDDALSWSSWSMQSLHRAIQVYTESTQSKSSQHRIYTEQFGVYTESTQSNADLHRVYTEQYGVYTESTQSNTDVHSWTYFNT